MGTIEQAAKRLDELRRAGVEVPRTPPGAGAAARTVPASGGGVQPRSPFLSTAPTAPVRTAAVEAVEVKRSREVQVDLDRLERAGYLVSNAARSELAEEFRVIKRPLLKNIEGQGAAPVHRANIVLVTSALPGEGKTFCALNLALSIAMEVDKTVLLVDADVVRPSLAERLGLPPQRGLLDVLEDAALDLADVLLKTNIPKLTVLQAGTPSARSTELLASDAMENLLDQMATKYHDRIIVFDAPPILVTTESRVLAARAGQVVMVVAAEETSRSAVTEAFAAVEACPVVMSVLNKCRVQGSGYGYGYRYGYGY